MFDGDIREREETIWFMAYSPKQKLTQASARVGLMGYEKKIH